MDDSDARASAASDAGDTLHWDAVFSLATNRFVIYDMLKVIGLTWAIMLLIFGMIFGVSDGPESLLPFLAILSIIMVGFLLLSMAIMLVFFGNRYPSRFTLSPRGAVMENLSGRARGANTAAMALGLLAGKPGLAGAGMLAKSQERVAISWKDVRRVREHPDQRVLSLMNGWRVVIRLYCSPENYDAAREFVRRHAREAA